jgi:hypothetical protein
VESRRSYTKVLSCFSVLTAATAIAVSSLAAEARLQSPGKLMAAASLACRQLAERDVFCEPLGESRRDLLPGIGYYTLQMRVGKGERDVITLHRVVAERRPGRPAPAAKAVFLVHGALFGFEAAYLGLSLYAEPPQVSFPVFLAQRGVDAWGISFRWAQIPVGFPDQSFMADWGMDVSVSDTRIGLRIARMARSLAGQGRRGLHVLGWSAGAWTAMALANAEAAEPPHQRDAAGFIPVEGTFKADPANAAYIQPWCDDAAYYQSLLDAGQFGADRSFFPYLGQLALDSPDEPSPIVPGLTNAQAAMGISSWPQGAPGNEWYHWAAGTFDANGVPDGLVYQEPMRLFREFTKTYGFDAVRYIRDFNAITCDGPDVLWDDHLAKVRAPMLFVGAGGAWGPLMEYQCRLVGGKDVKTLIVREQPPELAALDVGHLDILWAAPLRDLVWKPILAWIRKH